MVTPPPPNGGRWERGGQRPHEGRRGGNSAASVAARSRRVMPTTKYGGDALRRVPRWERRNRVADTALRAWLCTRFVKPRSGHGNAIEAGKRQRDGVAENPRASPADLPTCGRNAGRQNGRSDECLFGLHNVTLWEPCPSSGGKPQGPPLLGQNKKATTTTRYVTPINRRDGTRKIPCVGCAWTGG